MKKLIVVLCVALVVGSAAAEERDAETLVESMRKADMTYRELMEVMGRSSAMMHEGILRQNKQMVEVGANFIFTHPAPKTPPWHVMPEADQAAFKRSLVAFDEILDMHTKSIVEAANKKEWAEAANASNALMNACIACHATWKDKAR